MGASGGHGGTCSVSDTYTKFRNEVMAGGTDEPEPTQTAGGRRPCSVWGSLPPCWSLLLLWSSWAFVFVIGLLISIFLHEVGHFVTARWTGMKATQFFLFMGPKLWSFRRGETEYGVRAYPLGAFVRIIGMNNLDEVEPDDEPRAYRNKSYPRRLLVITAGSIMHMLIAIVSDLRCLCGQRSAGSRPDASASAPCRPAIPAEQGGVRPGDIVLSIDGVVPTTPDDVRRRDSQPSSRATPSTLVLERDGHR